MYVYMCIYYIYTYNTHIYTYIYIYIYICIYTYEVPLDVCFCAANCTAALSWHKVGRAHFSPLRSAGDIAYKAPLATVNTPGVFALHLSPLDMDSLGLTPGGRVKFLPSRNATDAECSAGGESDSDPDIELYEEFLLENGDEVCSGDGSNCSPSPPGDLFRMELWQTLFGGTRTGDVKTCLE